MTSNNTLTIDLAAQAAAALMGDLPGGGGGGSRRLPDFTIDKPGTYFFSGPIGTLEVNTSATVFVFGDVQRLSLREVAADRSNVTIFGDVEYIDVPDVWSDKLQITGATDVAYFDIGRFFDRSLGDVNFLISTSEEEGEYSFEHVDFARFYDANDLRIEAESATNIGVHGDDNFVFINELDGAASASGFGNDIEVAGGQGAIYNSSTFGTTDVEGFEGTVHSTGFGSVVKIDEGSFILDLTVGEDGLLVVEDSFVAGQVGFGTMVDLNDARAILELAGFNAVHQDGGQAIYDAQNGVQDTFHFTGGALADGTFDEFDLVELDSGAFWTMEELTAQGPVVELPFDNVVAADVVVDDGWMKA